MKNAIIKIVTNNLASSDITEVYDIIYTRSDCFIPANAQC
jgi:hypothetical protein